MKIIIIAPYNGYNLSTILYNNSYSANTDTILMILVCILLYVAARLYAAYLHTG